MVGIYFVVGKGYPPCFAKAPALFESPQSLEVKYQVKLPDVEYDVKSGKKAIVIFSIVDKEDLSGAVNWVISMKSEIKSKKCVAIAFLKGHTMRLEELLARAGCYDILKFDATAKAFAYKMNRTIKLMEREEAAVMEDVEISSNNNTTNNDASDVKALQKLQASNQQLNAKIEMVTALTVPSDYWMFRKKGHAKRFAKTWLVELIGPSPSVGKWENVGQDRWKWVPRENGVQFATGNADWVFVGKQPEYSWVVNRWGFVSETPNLSLIQMGKTVAVRFVVNANGALEVSTNSKQGVAWFPEVKKTFDRDYRIEVTSDHNIPWGDQIDSKAIDPSEWGELEMSAEQMKDWGKGDLSKEAPESKWNNMVMPGKKGKEQSPEFRFAGGLEAMKKIGISAKLKNYEVEIVEYTEDYSIVTVGLDRAMIELKEAVKISVKAENLGNQDDFTFEGEVTDLGTEDELGKTNIQVTLTKASQQQFRSMKDAWEKRQGDIMAFFNQVKGVS